ncbi:hypothetical protein A2U01_0080852, partial [Trifolium medium]|nr:hypothetical protein [Trifolium medium]
YCPGNKLPSPIREAPVDVCPGFPVLCFLSILGVLAVRQDSVS